MDPLLDGSRKKTIRSLIFSNVPSCGATLKSRHRGETKALPKRIPDGLSPLNSSPKIISQHCAQFAIQFARSCRITLAKKLLRVWCFQQHPRTPSCNKIPPKKLKSLFLPNSSPPKLSPRIGPKHLTSENSKVLSPKPSPEHFPTKFSKNVPIQLRPQHITPNAFPKDLQIVQKLSHIIGPRISQSSWRLPNVPVNIFPRFGFTTRNVPTQNFSHSHCFCTALT